jgi:tRNA-splicing ligase RtcB
MEPKFERIDEYRVRIPQQGGMRVPGLIFADHQMLEAIAEDQSPQQVMNVAHLPGIVGHSLAMPDMHWGYGFPIGGVAAFDERDGVLSPGGVGYDINCGVRLLRSNLRKPDVEGRLEELSLAIYKAVPCGVGSRSELRLSKSELDDVLEGGARWAVEQGLGDADDLEVIEEHGCFPGARPSEVSVRAKDRGRPQLGSLGSGNHFCELGYVAEIYDHEAAAAFGLEQDAITLLIHSGSRGLGHQICGQVAEEAIVGRHRATEIRAVRLARELNLNFLREFLAPR